MHTSGGDADEGRRPVEGRSYHGYYYTPEEAARLLDVDLYGLDKLVRQGTILAESIAGHLWYPANTIEDFVVREFGASSGRLTNAPDPHFVVMAARRRLAAVRHDEGRKTFGKPAEAARESGGAGPISTGDRYYTVDQASQKLDKPPHQLWMMAFLGKLQAEPVGDQRLFLRRSVDDMASRQKTRASDKAARAGERRPGRGRSQPSRHYSVEEAARKLGTSEDDVWHMAFLGKLTEEVVDGERVLSRRDVDARAAGEGAQPRQGNGSPKPAGPPQSPDVSAEESGEGGSPTGEVYCYSPAQTRRLLGGSLYQARRTTLPRIIVERHIWYLAKAVDELAAGGRGGRKGRDTTKPRKVRVPEGEDAKPLDAHVGSPDDEADERHGSVRGAKLARSDEAETPAGQGHRLEPPKVGTNDPSVGGSTSAAEDAREGDASRAGRTARSGPRAASDLPADHASALMRLLSESGSAREELKTMDESLDDKTLGTLLRCLDRRPRGLEDLLVFFASCEPARRALLLRQTPSGDAVFDALDRLSRTVERRIESGSLHRAALMDFAPVQDAGCRFVPPPRDLPGLLQLLQYTPGTTLLGFIEMLEKAVVSSSLGEDLHLLLERLDARSVEVIRRRYSPEPNTLKEASERFGITRERVRQVQAEAAKCIREAYHQELPLPGLRSAMLLVNEHEAFAAHEMTCLLRGRGLLGPSGAESLIGDFIAVWRALEPSESDAPEHLMGWRAVRPRAYAFPEEISAVARTGLTPAQQEISKKLRGSVGKRVSRSGAFRLREVLTEVFDGAVPAEADVDAVLSRKGYVRAPSGYWVEGSVGPSVPRRIAEKMLATCGPLDVGRIHAGIDRHQSRHGYHVPPVDVIRAALQRCDTLEVQYGGEVRVKTPDLVARNLGAWERVWLGVLREHGPVVHYHKILEAYARNGLSKVMAHVLLANSCLVEKVEDLLYCLPGATVTEEDSKRGREQAIPRRSRTSSSVAAPVGGSGPAGLVEGEDAGGSLEPNVSEVLRGGLRLDPETGRVFVTVPGTDWSGDVKVRLLWDGRERAVPSSYRAEEDTTFVRALDLPVGEPLWGRDALVVAGSDRRALRLPSPPGERGMVFRCKGGRRTLRWRTGEEYHVVVPAANFSGHRADTIFEEWTRVGRPKGWNDHLVLRVRTREPSAVVATTTRRGDGSVAGVARSLEDAARSLGLPAYDDLRRLRGRLIGGERLPSPVGGDAFSSGGPPRLEIGGLWENPLPVALSKANRATGDFVVLDSLRVPPSAEATTIVSLWDPGRPVPSGVYRVRVGDQKPLEFSIAGPRGSGAPRVLDVRLGLEGATGSNDDGNRVMPRSDLRSGVLTARAWPGARLDLEVASGPWKRLAAVTADEDGGWSARWDDLGMGDAPAGAVDVAVYWRGAAASRMTFADGPRILEGDAKLVPQEREMGGTFTLSGELSGAARGARGRAVLIGPRPWNGQVRSETIVADERCGFEARFPFGGEARWIVVLPEGGPTDGMGGRPWLVQARGTDPLKRNYPLSDLYAQEGGETGGGGWNDLHRELDGHPLPPDLRRLLDLSSLAHAIGRDRGLLRTPATEARWVAVESGSLSRLARWTHFGMRLPVAIFSAQAALGDAPAGRSLDLMTVDASGLLTAMESGGGEVTLRSEKSGSPARGVKGTLGVRASDGGWAFELRTRETLYACPRCALVLPPGDFGGHRPPLKGSRRCHEVRRSYAILGAGKSFAAEARVHLDPGLLLPSVVELVRRVGQGDEGGVPSHAEPWLDRLQEAFFEEADGEDPSRWITRVGDLLERLVGLGEKTGENEAALAHLGRAVARHELGIGVVSDWVRDEVK